MPTTEALAKRVHGAALQSDSPSTQTVDILGIGFGPANLSLAIAVEEINETLPSADRLTCRFVEGRPRFGWHDDMLLPGATMQVSFIKDLVSLRTPTSSYSFLNYLKERGRLIDFINHKTFFPTRREYHDYLRWAALRNPFLVEYGTTATRIDREGDEFRVALSGASDGSTAGAEVTEHLAARNVVIGTGIRPTLPDGIVPGVRVFHNHRLLSALDALPSRRHRRFLVVGAGQSAAEVAAYLHDTYPDAEVHASFRRFGYTPSDDTPFANRIFDPASVDEFYTAPADLKRRLLEYHSLTNYAAVDSELIGDLYRREYDESVRGQRRLFMHRVTEIESICERPDGVIANLRDLGDRHGTRLEVDAVVLATGFLPGPVRELLGSGIDQEATFDDDLPIVDRDYRLSTGEAPGGIYLNGAVEHSHGLTSSLLSNLAMRASDILHPIVAQRASLTV